MPNAQNQITAKDYNDLRDKILSVLGTGAASYGYGQVYNSSPVTAVSPAERDVNAGVITAAQWDALRYDLASIRLHQTGVDHIAGTTPLLIDAVPSQLIGYGAPYPYVNYTTLADLAITDRFNLASSRAELLPGATISTSAAWSNQISTTITVTFASAANARYFFNTGCQIQVNLNKAGGSSSAQNLFWTNLLNEIGTLRLGGALIYTLTNSSWVELYQSPLTSLYRTSQTYVKIEAQCNVPSNSTGTATSFSFRVTLVDTYQDPPVTNSGGSTNTPSMFPPGDLIDGTLTMVVTNYHAALLPLEPLTAGNYMTVPSPSSIAASAFSGT